MLDRDNSNLLPAIPPAPARKKALFSLFFLLLFKFYSFNFTVLAIAVENNSSKLCQQLESQCGGNSGNNCSFSFVMELFWLVQGILSLFASSLVYNEYTRDCYNISRYIWDCQWDHLVDKLTFLEFLFDGAHYSYFIISAY